MSPWSYARCFLRGCVDIDCSLREHASTSECLPVLSINRRPRPAEREPVASNQEFTRFEYSKDVYESDRLIMSTLFDDALVPLSASFMATLVISGCAPSRGTGVSSNEAKTAAPVYIPSDIRER